MEENQQYPSRMKKIPLQVRSQQKVEKILQTAKQIIFNEGIQELNTNKIASYSGVTVGSIYQYFEDKEAIIYELYRKCLDEIFQHYCQLSESLKDETNPTRFFMEIAKDFSSVIGKSQYGYWRLFDVSKIHYPSLLELEKIHDQRVCNKIFNDARRLLLVEDNLEGRRRVNFAYNVLLSLDDLLISADPTDVASYIQYIESSLTLVLKTKNPLAEKYL